MKLRSIELHPMRFRKIAHQPFCFVLWLVAVGLAVWSLGGWQTTGSAQQANLLRNGSFDNGSVGLALTTVPDWTITRGNVDVLPGSPSHPLGVWQHAADGPNSLDLNGTPGVGTIRQTFQTEPGRKYTFAGWVSHHYGTPEASANVYVNGTALSPLYHNTPNQQGDLKWQGFSREFTANSTQTTLTLEDRNLAGYEFGGTLLDGLSVVAQSSNNTVSVVNQTMTGTTPGANCAVPPTKTVFAPTDAKAFLWMSLAGMRNGDVIKADFVQPNGGIYTTAQGTISGNGSGCPWASLDIAGQPAANLPGAWQIRIIYNNVPLLTGNFTITGDNAPPTPTVGAAVIIDGTDANEHGDNNSGRSNDNGWLYMQKVLENLASRVPAGTAKVVVDLGTTNSRARNAIVSAFNLSSLPGQGWTIRHEDGAAAITNWLAGLSSTNTGILYIPTYNLTTGDLEAVELAAINAQARRIADFVNRVSGNGGALFAMGEVESSSKPGAWIWLRELFPGIVVTQIPGSGGVNTSITLTADGNQAFPGLSNSEVGAAKPWHNYFSGDLATLKVLGVAPEGSNGPSRQIILGGIGIEVPPPVPTQNRIIRLGCGSASPGGQLQVPVELVSQGDENALGFSLNFDPSVLSNPQVARGNAAGSVLLNINTSQVGQGRIGVALALPSGQAFSTGARQIVVVTFSVANTSATNTSIEFGDSPIRRQVSNANAQTLDATYQGCSNITIAPAGYEADVTPRPNGKNDGSISITDLVQVGRFAAGLDAPSGGSEFQRADCAPRDQKGDGQISITDWVQAGRYAAGLDSAQTAGGPTSSFGFSVTEESLAAEATAHGRHMRIVSTAIQRGQTGTVAIEIEAEGDENAVGLSLEFDPTALSFVSVSAGSSLENPLLNVNSNQAANGRVGLAMALPAGKALKAGKQTLVLVRFTALTGGGAASTPLAFSDQPIRRQLADANANSISGEYENGTISFGNVATSVSAASFKPEASAESINAAFGTGLATATVVGNQLPLPTSLAGTTVKVKDSAGTERLAPLFFVAPQQVNYLMPTGTAAGAATITITSGNGAIATGSLNITTVAPSLFTANSSGQGVPAAVLLRVKASGQQVYEPVARFDATQNRMVPVTIDFGPDLGSGSDQLYLLLFGSGLRYRSNPGATTVLAGNQPVEVLYVGAQGDMAGLDQLNLRLPRSMAGRGLVNLAVTVDGRSANTVQIAF